DAVPAAQHHVRLVARLGEIDSLYLGRGDLHRPPADTEAKRRERPGHEEAVAVAHEGAKGRGRRGRAAAGTEAPLRDSLGRPALCLAAGGEVDRLVLEEAAERVAVREDDPGKSAFAGVEEDG